MTVGQIFTKIGSFIENRHKLMLLHCNCTKLANFEDFFKRAWEGGVFSWTQCKMSVYTVSQKRPTFDLL